MVSKKARLNKSWVYRGLLSSTVLLTVACGGQMPFNGKIQVAGDLPPPPPPPPPPKKVDPPPKPKKVLVKDNKIEITEKIQFEVSKATIKEESFPLLNEIVDTIKENPHIKKIAIEGHASKEGGAVFNRKLSDDRAKSVRQYLIDHGIAEGVLTAKGFGFDKPIADNDTEEGKEKNRRVEFNIIEQDVTKKKVEVDPDTGKEKVLESDTQKIAAPAEPDEKSAKPEEKKAAPAEKKKPAIEKKKSDAKK
jgi:outer membrane protein OmpA-like peptidoglycan-associated protein